MSLDAGVLAADLPPEAEKILMDVVIGQAHAASGRDVPHHSWKP